MDEYIDLLVKAAVFFTLDDHSGDGQVEIEKTDRNKTAFRFHYGLNRFVQRPSALKNVPGTFQCAMDVIWSLAPVKWQLALVYLDYIAVFLRSPCNDIEHVKRVFHSYKMLEMT